MRHNQYIIRFITLVQKYIVMSSQTILIVTRKLISDVKSTDDRCDLSKKKKSTLTINHNINLTLQCCLAPRLYSYTGTHWLSCGHTLKTNGLQVYGILHTFIRTLHKKDLPTPVVHAIFIRLFSKSSQEHQAYPSDQAYPSLHLANNLIHHF